ncbi:myosin regulatory light chain 2, ventricular/cardiac muscle isoform isoform X1 [Hyperolius riggenbachi]|uniref:myosin regulatory light chain 2, ventricular/cardiac muscle isoform isoform X1 n=1 Tax=Hyperolius riggenbachi TaxID=752182 RepID=UPI0035A2A1E7
MSTGRPAPVWSSHVETKEKKVVADGYLEIEVWLASGFVPCLEKAWKPSPKKAKKRAEGANSNVFSMFEQTQIQEFKEAFTIMDQNRDGFIDKEDLRDTFAALGRLNVKNEELDEMLQEASGPINFTVFLTMFGEKLKGADPEETILSAFKVFDPEGSGLLKSD